jgi:hypothetical protein
VGAVDEREEVMAAVGEVELETISSVTTTLKASPAPSQSELVRIGVCMWVKSLVYEWSRVVKRPEDEEEQRNRKNVSCCLSPR